MVVRLVVHWVLVLAGGPLALVVLGICLGWLVLVGWWGPLAPVVLSVRVGWLSGWWVGGS